MVAIVVTAHSEPATHGLALRCDRLSTLSSPNVASARPAPSSTKTSVPLIDAKRLVADDESLREIASPESPKKADGKMEVAKGATEMTLRTKDRDKAGTTTYSASAHYTVPLDDLTACGNQGLEGADEFNEWAEGFPTKAKALAWLRRTVQADRAWWNAYIEQYDWQGDSFEWEGDTVLDAIGTHVYTWSYFIDGHTVKPDGEYRP